MGVDSATLATTPTVRPAVEAFVARVSAIDGGKPVPTKLTAYTFEPAVVPRAKEALIQALDGLVQATQGG